MMRLRDAGDADHDSILRLNTGAVPHVNRISLDQLTRLHEECSSLRVATSAEEIVGFLLALPEGARYESPNYRWFSERYPSFVYIDRVVVDPAARRLGVGRLLYTDLEALARPRAPVLTCEVNLRPTNPGSMLFHEALGFREVGQQDTDGGAKRVRLMVKSLEPTPA